MTFADLDPMTIPGTRLLI